jgi:hypothetical protein
VAPLLLVAGLGAAPANADPVSVQSLASCSAHWANTAAWMDCTGGSQAGWVRLGYNCGIPPITRDHHTDWYSLFPGQTRTVSASCNVRVNGAWPNVRAY